MHCLTPFIKNVTTFNCNPTRSFASGRKGYSRRRQLRKVCGCTIPLGRQPRRVPARGIHHTTAVPPPPHCSWLWTGGVRQRRLWQPNRAARRHTLGRGLGTGAWQPCANRAQIEITTPSPFTSVTTLATQNNERLALHPGASEFSVLFDMQLRKA